MIPIPPVKSMLSVDKLPFPVTKFTPDPIKEYKLVLRAGANTEPHHLYLSQSHLFL